ncbi:hydantoinase B/oxoprolinase [Xylona heveae TC161]|uniref:Hydantoinase B/oxoprolinase n=1 Tax=Xylona heveae (strain CBS 132557 / TC161) TaxID=1328760 RepID=A0A165IC22_XYLHT|nr:hydantoinase B/oxoprolinase [Xylona heveae TC161]KZF24691.1 hydantoinase B/oxoprolinase [Xylona heveae TC161]
MIAKAPEPGIRIAIDRGGTFTDCVASVPGQNDIVLKLLSVDPGNYPDAPVEAIRRVLERATGKSYPKGQKISLTGVESIRMGTTVATNALLERKGADVALVVTEGLKDLLHIGNQSRPRMFDLAINKPDVLYSKVVEVSERVTLEAWSESNVPEKIDISADKDLVQGVTGEAVRILQPMDTEKVRKDLQELYDVGYRSVAVCLMHSYTFRDHELAVGKIAADIGFTNISLSCELAPVIKAVPRGNSATADAYLTPEIKKYIEGFVSGFTDLESSNCRCEFMQSDGGLVEFSRLSGLRAILSGPAGGVTGYAKTSFDDNDGTPVIGFDMGGTSTDVSRYAGEPELIFETTTAGVTIQSPQLDINTVAAGGGSILTWRNGLFAVGPDSAGSHPGPACYRKGGPLTVCDANVVLGRLIPDSFPKIFGPNENEGLDVERSRELFALLTKEINNETNLGLTLEQVAAGFLDVANEAMCRPIRALTEAKGHDAGRHNLASFGGAGGQHACSIAKVLGIRRVLIHKYSSILSAYGMALADISHEERMPSALNYESGCSEALMTGFKTIEDRAEQALLDQGCNYAQISTDRYYNLRFQGSDTPLMIQETDKEGGVVKAFYDAHQKEFGFTPSDRPVIVDDIRVRSTGKSVIEESCSPLEELKGLIETSPPKPSKYSQVYFAPSGWTATPTYQLPTLSQGAKIQGPAMIIDNTQTIVVLPNATATILSAMVIIDLDPHVHDKLSNKVDPIQLSIFGHRFMSIAEQMGRALQKTSVSTNIKERLDFTCAVFASNGGLVANAPHVPAMIGSMAFAVKWQINHWGNDLRPGDVILSNSPMCGGTHLPDLTVITPVFDAEGKNIIFWTASRGHHADIGGVLPGSMPPNSRELWEEGAVMEAFKVVRGGKFQEEELINLLMKPSEHPGCSGTRCLRDNISDIKAQAAANHRGTQLIQALIRDYGLDVVQLYMAEIQGASEQAVRNMLKDIAERQDRTELEAVDYMDDGTPIQLKVSIDKKTGSAVFDFDGTGPEAYGNWNAPIAICHSAIIFALRCMVDADIPLNQGAIAPITIEIPENSLLRPSPEAACCAGNVLTSQRIVDVIFKAFKASSASQGCMNNLTFGRDEVENGFGYYETICGGSGAGPKWAGTSGVHTNMTNTRITDPETLEKRYPVVLRRFCLRPGSGGRGMHRGGDGIIRDIEFRIPMKVSILSERRVTEPYGLEGGECGKRGKNLWVKSNGRVVNLGGKNTASVHPGDRVIIESPGGGGWGSPQNETEVKKLVNTFTSVANGSVDVMRALGEQA